MSEFSSVITFHERVLLVPARKPRRCVAASVFQATDRDDTHAIRTAIGKIAGSGQDHQEGGRVHFIGINFSAIAFRLFAPSSMSLSPPSLISTSPYFPFLK